MFTIMWKHKDGEELYGAHGVSLLNKDSEGPDRIAFQHYVVALGEPVPVLSRSVIGTGDVFVMNEASLCRGVRQIRPGRDAVLR